MDFLKSHWDRVRQQVDGLGASQKMLAAALVAIMVMTVAWWGRYAGQAEMEPLLNQPFSQEEIGRVQQRLALERIRYEVQGDRVLVPADEKFRALAALSYDQLLPQDTSNAFDQMVKDMNPWEPTGTTQKKFLLAKQTMLGKMIREWPEVSKAVVIIDATNERHFGGSVTPSASVMITSRGRGVKVGRKLAEAAADVVCGAQAGLARNQVKVVIDGATVPLDGGLDGASIDGDRVMEQIAQCERYRAERIRELLRDIKGVLISVTAKLNVKSEHETRHTYDQVTSKEKQTTSETTESNATTPAAEPGVGSNNGANTPMVINGGGGAGGTSQTQQKEITSFENFPSESTKTINSPAGEAVVTGVSIRVPVSYFSNIVAAKYPSIKDPTDEGVLQPLMDRELGIIRQQVMRCAGLEQESQVVVNPYMDARIEPAVIPTETTASSIQAVVGTHFREIGVLALAAVSLFMVSTMVRKGGATAVIPTHKPEPQPAPTLNMVGEVVGEVGGGNSLLDAVEMDDSAVKAQQMLDEVSDMVKEDPDAAATLVKRWLNRA